MSLSKWVHYLIGTESTSQSINNRTHEINHDIPPTPYFLSYNQSLTSNTVLLWYAFYGLLFALFYVFSSPFTQSRELRRHWSAYVKLNTGLYVWLMIALMFHLPIFAYDSRIPLSLFSPLFLGSVLTLLILEGMIKVLDRWFVFHVGFIGNSLEVVHNALIVSVICCFTYAQCGSSSSSILERALNSINHTASSATQSPSDTLDATVNKVCALLFAHHTSGHSRDLPTVLILWTTAISMLVINFMFERLVGFRGLFADTKRATMKDKLIRDVKQTINHKFNHSSSQPINHSINQPKVQQPNVHDATKRVDENSFLPSTNQSHDQPINQHSSRRAPRALATSYVSNITSALQSSILSPIMLDMVSWYEIAVSSTAVDLFIHLKLFLGRFDMRTLQFALPHARAEPMHNKSTQRIDQSVQVPFYYDHLAQHDELWFDWMSDCGDGFNPSYQVARMLAQPALRVSVKRRASKQSGVLQLPRAKALFLGGDLAYPNPSPESYENRFFNTFQCAMPPPLHFDPAEISIAKPLGGFEALARYDGPECWALAGNHDWFDGLQTYLRYICGRDWLGGWLLPQEKSWFAHKLAHGWWIFGMDNALSNDIDVNQYQYFARLAATLDENDRVIMMYHEPDWVINGHEHVNICANIYHLQRILDGRVVLKIAGDLHHYTRHMPAPPEADIVPFPENEEASFTRPHGMPSEVDLWRWYSPISWFTSLMIGRRSYNSRVYMEDLLTDIAPSLDSELKLARTASSPVFGINQTTAALSRATSSINPVHSFTPVPSSSLGSPLHVDTKPRSRFSLVDSPPPSPHDHSSHSSPAYDVARRLHVMNNMPRPLRPRSQQADREPDVAARSSSQPNDSESNVDPETTERLCSKHMQDWTLIDVLSWLSLIKFTDLVPVFSQHDVDGILLVKLDDDDLVAELGMTSRLRRKKLLAARDQWCKRHVLSRSLPTSPQLTEIDMSQPLTSHSLPVLSLTPPTIQRTLAAATDELGSTPINHANHFTNSDLDRSVSSLGYERTVCVPASHVRRDPPILIVSGGGGAFLHTTHVPSSAPINVHGEVYVRTTSYPSLSTSRAYALLNIFGFRKRNFRFDLFGGCVYFLLVYSLLPLCHVDDVLTSDSWLQCLSQFLRVIMITHLRLFEETWFSLAVFLAAWFGFVQLAEESWPMWKRFFIGSLHCLAHSFAAIGAVVFLETFVEIGIKRGLLAIDEPVLMTFAQAFPALNSVLALADSYTWNATSGLVRLLSLIFDVPENMASLKVLMCKTGAGPMSRAQVLGYYISTGCYLWVLATSLVSFVFGTYLYVMSAFFNAHATPASSSLRVEGYKNFIRFHLTNKGDLEVFVLGLDRCPRRWEIDPLWSGFTQPGALDDQPSHQWKVPSSLKPCAGEPDGLRLVDYLVIRNPRPIDTTEPNSAPATAQKTSTH